MTSSPNAATATRILNAIKQRILITPAALILLWWFTLWWGERTIFQRSVKDCAWNKWETWPTQAQPYHILLVADPQLVDPHTYPGRPWPLSTLTVLYTDIYLRRTYDYLQDTTRPDATLFLGDLFDGGREWGTPQSSSPEQRYRKYGTIFWLKEYIRFSKIYLRSWHKYSTASQSTQRFRRIISSVPGNHDLGFANGIQPAVRSRFDAFFGPLNRIDVLGNHTVVSLDTVSLSAMDQIDPKTGSSGAGDGSAKATTSSKIWNPVEDFLMEAKATRSRAIDREFRNLKDPFSIQDSISTKPHFVPDVISLSDVPTTVEHFKTFDLSVPSAQFPTIVLSHVPLYRAPDCPCGPYRERGNSIPISAGYQYQNVLTPSISQDIVKHLIPEEIAIIYSGDDHDYCEIEHNEFTGRIKEITVKSTSWAMGVRKPGVQLVSLWNPIDIEKIKSGADLPHPKNTIQNHLCLLPDQLSIFIRYGQLLFFTLFVITVHAIRYNPRSAASSSSTSTSEPLLPISERGTPRKSSSTSSISPSSSHNVHTQRLSTTTRKLGTYGNLPSSSRSSSPNKQLLTPSPSVQATPDPFAPAFESHVVRSRSEDHSAATNDWGMPRARRKATGSRSKTRLLEFRSVVWQVAWPVLLFYFWLLRNG